MIALLTRYSWRPTIGLVIGDRWIALSVVATTPLGREQVFHDLQACDGETRQTVLEQLLRPWIKRGWGKKTGLGPRVQLGMPESKVFQAVVPITPMNRNAPPESYFLGASQATNVRGEDRIVDLVKLELNKQSLACLAVCPRGEITASIELMKGVGTQVGLAEPVPAALYRAGAFFRKDPRGSKLAVRFFLGQKQAIGVLAAGAQPLFWHIFNLPLGDPTTEILAAYSTLRMIGRRGRLELSIDTVIIHGRPDLVLTHDPVAFQQRTGAELIRCPEPDYDPATAALGVALANPDADGAGHDLARTLKPPVSIREIFPWGQLVLHSILLGAFSLFLSGTVAEANARLKAVGGELASLTWLKDQDQAKLETEKKFVEEKAKVIKSFRDNRVDWSMPLRIIAAEAPRSTIVTGLSGIAEVETTAVTGPAKTRQQLIVQFATPMSEDGVVPREIDGFLATLRDEPTLKSNFPVIEISGLRANAAQAERRPFASYSIICLPKTEPSNTIAAH